MGVHEGFDDLGESEVFVFGDEVCEAGDEGVEVSGETSVLEAVGYAGGEAGEALEHAACVGLLGLGGGGGDHGHAGELADSLGHVR